MPISEEDLFLFIKKTIKNSYETDCIIAETTSVKYSPKTEKYIKKEVKYLKTDYSYKSKNNQEYLSAQAEYNKGHYNKSIDICNKALKYDENNCKLLNIKAKSFFRKEEYQKSVDLWDKVLKIDNTFKLYYYEKAYAEDEIGKFQEALNDINYHIDVLKNINSDAYILRGVIYKDLGEFDQARQNYLKALKINHKDEVAKYNLLELDAEIAYEKDDFDKVIEICKEALKFYENDSDFLNRKAQAHYSKEEYQVAVSLWNEILKRDISYKLNYFDKAYAEEQIEKFQDALKDWNYYIKTEQINLESAYNRRGFVNEQLGYFYEAKQDYQEALEINPRFKDAKRNLERIDEKILNNIIEIITKENINDESILSSFGFRYRTQSDLKQNQILTIKDIKNINLKELKIKYNFSTTSIDDLMQFMETNDIPFVNKDISKTGLYKYQLSPNIKAVLYAKGIFYIENLKNINLISIKKMKGMGAVLFDELIDLLIANNIPYYPKMNNHSQRLKDTSLSVKAIDLLYNNGFFYTEDLINKDVNKIFSNSQIKNKTEEEIYLFLKKIGKIQEKNNKINIQKIPENKNFQEKISDKYIHKGNESFCDEKPLISLFLRDRTIMDLKRNQRLTIKDIQNIDLQELKTKEKFSVTSIDELMQFMETNGIPFVNKDISKTGLYKYPLNPSIKAVLYSNGIFYIENLKSKLSYIKNRKGMGTALYKELSDFLKKSNSQKIKDIHEYLDSAQIHYDNNHYDTVIEICSEALKYYENNCALLNLKAMSHFENDEYQVAVSLWNKILKIDVSYKIEYFDKAFAEEQIGQLQESLKDMNYYIEKILKDKSREDVYNYRGLIKENLEYWDDAKRDYQEALKINPRSKDAKRNLKRIEEKLLNKSIEIINKENINDECILSSFDFRVKTKIDLNRNQRFMIRDIRNIDLKELKTKEKFSVTSIDDLMQFMETNDIPFVNKDISKTGLYKYDLSPNIKSVLYSNGIFYIENLKNKLSYIKNLNGMGTVLFDELSDFIKTSRYRKIEDI